MISIIYWVKEKSLTQFLFKGGIMMKVKKQVMVIETLTYYVDLETEVEDENEEIDWEQVVHDQFIPDKPETHINEDLDINVVEVDDNERHERCNP